MTWTQDAVGHAGYALLIVGQLAVAHGIRTGWYLRLAGELLWIGIGWSIGSTSIVSWGLVGAAVELLGAWRSRK